LKDQRVEELEDLIIIGFKDLRIQAFEDSRI